MSVLASVLVSAVSDCEEGIGTVRARQWCACGHERWLGWFVRLLQAREQVCYVGCYPCKTRSVIVTWCARCGGTRENVRDHNDLVSWLQLAGPDLVWPRI